MLAAQDDSHYSLKCCIWLQKLRVLVEDWRGFSLNNRGLYVIDEQFLPKLSWDT